MLVEERRQQVLDLVSRRGFVGMTELAQAIGVSESTIRRDIGYWTRKGMVRGTRGGAMTAGNGGALPALEDRS
ncbi:MAG: DeoR family transcriptional regulator [Gemmataceae bacterium]